MADYYKSEDFANTQLHYGRQAGIRQATLEANLQLDKLTEEANRRIRYLNDLNAEQANHIRNLEAALATKDMELHTAMAALSATRDTLDAVVTQNPAAFSLIAKIFRGFYVKHSQIAIDNGDIRTDPVKSASFQKLAPKTHKFLATILSK
ncbi:hypothetical protein SJI19_16590 [Acerihabitans sp. TG2]|uniref:hypothetical protein n=1 Tax=Acerihabitans sp. TG2 TaxID=3096008 RepID=UPI002B22F59F|nr:hypothetical protein [Acerihabitans sp. TG2]MEA9392143.1 hypothetical protein [Acerihabitans sp. TG2]